MLWKHLAARQVDSSMDLVLAQHDPSHPPEATSSDPENELGNERDTIKRCGEIVRFCHRAPLLLATATGIGGRLRTLDATAHPSHTTGSACLLNCPIQMSPVSSPQVDSSGLVEIQISHSTCESLHCQQTVSITRGRSSGQLRDTPVPVGHKDTACRNERRRWGSSTVLGTMGSPARVRLTRATPFFVSHYILSTGDALESHPKKCVSI